MTMIILFDVPSSKTMKVDIDVEDLDINERQKKSELDYRNWAKVQKRHSDMKLAQERAFGVIQFSTIVFVILAGMYWMMGFLLEVQERNQTFENRSSALERYTESKK